MSRLTIYRDDYSDATIVSNQFIDEYMENANDAQIKVYLYLLRMMHANLPTSISDIADKFNHTEKDVVRALSYWEKKNLVRIEYDENGEILALHMQSGTSSTPTAPAGGTAGKKQALLQPGRGYILSTGRGSFPDYFYCRAISGARSDSSRYQNNHLLI